MTTKCSSLKIELLHTDLRLGLEYELRSECSLCAPMGVRILVSITVLRKRRFSYVDGKSLFLRTSAAERFIYVIPPSKSANRIRFLWLLLTESYGLVNANAKFLVQSDNLPLGHGLC